MTDFRLTSSIYCEHLDGECFDFGNCFKCPYKPDQIVGGSESMDEKYISVTKFKESLAKLKVEGGTEATRATIARTLGKVVPQLLYDEPSADVQQLSVVAEHIKERLYETAFNTDEPIASKAISDMAERIDFWISELKDGETNG